MSKTKRNKMFYSSLGLSFLILLAIYTMKAQGSKASVVTDYIQDIQMDHRYSDYNHVGEMLFPSHFASGTCVKDFNTAYCHSNEPGLWVIQISYRPKEYFLDIEKTSKSYREQGASVFLIELRKKSWFLSYSQSSIDSLGAHSWLAVTDHNEAEYLFDFKIFKDIGSEEQAELVGFIKSVFWVKN